MEQAFPGEYTCQTYVLQVIKGGDSKNMYYNRGKITELRTKVYVCLWH